MTPEQLTFRSPKTEEEWLAYYNLRWEILRKPWGQPVGSEKDELEAESFHIAAFDSDNSIIAVGRVHQLDSESAQIRYMAVSTNRQRNGIGIKLLNQLESVAKKHGAYITTLNARDDYLGFYSANGYRVKEKGHTLFGSISHTIMIKEL